MADKVTERKYLLPEIFFTKHGELVDDLCIIKLAIEGGMPVAFNYEGKERIVESKFIFKIDAKDYLIGYDIEGGNLCSFSFDKIEMVFLVQGDASLPVLDVLTGAAYFCLNPNSAELKKLLKNRIIKRAVIRKKECCLPKAGQKVIGEIEENGEIHVHSYDCREAKKYWWT